MQELRARQLKDLASAAAYITLLFAEQPRYRPAIIKYVIGVLWGTTRQWRGEAPKSRRRIVSLGRMLCALLSGPWLYYRSLRVMEHSERSPSNARRDWASQSAGQCAGQSGSSSSIVVTSSSDE
jgi:hypothetical protein